MRRKRVLKRLETEGEPARGLSRSVDSASTFVKCSFCGKSQQQVDRLVAGPGVYICNECVELCNDAMRAPRDEVKAIPGPQPVPESRSTWHIDVSARTDQAQVKDAILRDINHWSGRVEIHVRETDWDGDTDPDEESD